MNATNNPIKAVNPGLVYDADQTDYVKSLCRQGYKASAIQTITEDNITCSKATNATVCGPELSIFALSIYSLSSPIDQATHSWVVLSINMSHDPTYNTHNRESSRLTYVIPVLVFCIFNKNKVEGEMSKFGFALHLYCRQKDSEHGVLY